MFNNEMNLYSVIKIKTALTVKNIHICYPKQLTFVIEIMCNIRLNRF